MKYLVLRFALRSQTVHVREEQSCGTCLIILLVTIFMLVDQAHAQTCYSAIPASTPTSRFTDNGDGTVTDVYTDLTWKRCVEGQNWDGATCSGTPSLYTWQQALQLAATLNAGGGYAGQTDWRVPNIKELGSIIESQCYGPAINLNVFPGTYTTSSKFWSASPNTYALGYVWITDIGSGTDSYSHTDVSYYVLLVRGKTYTEVVDITSPQVSIGSPTDGAVVNTASVLVSGTASDDTSLATVVVSGVTATLNGNAFTATVPLSEGANTLTAVVTDAAGNSSSASINVTYIAVVIPVPVAAFGPINDTGITKCADIVSRDLTCVQTQTGYPAAYPGQDGEHGRDAAAQAGTLTKIGAGHAGFDFTKLDAVGNSMSATATSWSCVRDNFTGLVWEVKTDDGGLRDKDNTYSWYNPDTNTNGGGSGGQNGGVCTGGISCDTYSYVQAANNQNLCGFNDWRLPWQEELRSIVDYDYSLLTNASPTIDISYFPNSLRVAYWSASPEASLTTYAWCINFNDGTGNSCDKLYRYNVRLVRGQ